MTLRCVTMEAAREEAARSDASSLPQRREFPPRRQPEEAAGVRLRFAVTNSICGCEYLRAVGKILGLNRRQSPSLPAHSPNKRHRPRVGESTLRAVSLFSEQREAPGIVQLPENCLGLGRGGDAQHDGQRLPAPAEHLHCLGTLSLCSQADCVCLR